MSVNYVIATWAGKSGSVCRNKLTKTFPHPKDYLKEHLKQLTSVKHDLKQVTIMRAHVEDSTPKYETYYDDLEIYIEKLESKGTNVEFLDCENFGLSYGQYFEAFQKYNDDFDFYCFIEDDYAPGIDDFDKILKQIYQNKFSDVNDIGFLCSWAPKLKGIKFHAAFEFGLISSKTMKLLYQHFPNPKNAFFGLHHGNIQVKYSDLFLKSSIPIKDFTDLYATPYYKGVKKKLLNCSVSPKSQKCLFFPLQMIRNYSESAIDSIQIHGWLKCT